MTSIVRIVLTVLMLSLAATAAAQTYPGKSVRVVVPFAPGGTSDFVARIFAGGLSKELGQQFVIDNRGGAGGTIGADLAAKSPADGYTLLLFNIAMAFGPALYSPLAYDPVNDFAPVSMLGSAPSVLLVNPALPARTLSEFLALARAKPGALDYGTGGVGSSGHLAVELLQSMARVKFTHVPYKGGGPAFQAAMSGEVAFLIETAGPVVPQIKAGRLRALGVTSAERLSLLPDVPTLAQAGLKGYAYTTWYALWAPAKTPPAIVTRLNQAVQKVAGQADIRSSLQSSGVEPDPSTPAQLDAHVRAELAKWNKIIRDAGIKTQ
ncbi:MAG: Bug family tripartite tricarboxylate transporter substrate binding protein [Burkholderiales bacterium]